MQICYTKSHQSKTENIELTKGSIRNFFQNPTKIKYVKREIQERYISVTRHCG